MKAVVVGAGIMGLSVARGLTQAGWRVELLEQGRLPDPRASSHDRSRLIRRAYGGHTGYMVMVGDAFAAWDRLWDDLGQRHYLETGAVMLETDGADWARTSAAALAAAGLPIERLDARAMLDRCPMLVGDDLLGGWYCLDGGVLYADRILTDLVDWLRAAGAVLLPNTPVVSVDAQRAVAETAQGWRSEGDLLVVCAGPWTGRLLPDLAGRLAPSRQLVLYVEPPLERLFEWREAPMILDIAGDSGCYIVPPGPSISLKLGDHLCTEAGDPDADRTPVPGEARRLLDTARRRLRDPAGYKPSAAKVCYYTVAEDERFVVEPMGGKAWVLGGFSGHGFKFGPLLGDALAAVVSGQTGPAAIATAAALTAWAAGREAAEGGAAG